MASSTELGDALRHWRHRLGPESVGLAARPARRTLGLRREEVAHLAGLSVDYLIRLEQGRFIRPSSSVCVALARALQLSGAEQAHLFQLAGHASGPTRLSRIVPKSAHRLVDHFEDRPVAVYDAIWTILLWNPLWAAAIGDPLASEEWDHNVLLRVFEDGATRLRHTPVEQDAFERTLVGDLRTTSARYPDDPEVAALVTRLKATGERFVARWEEYDLGSQDDDHKLIDHPEVGLLDVDCDILTPWRHDLRVVVYTARTEETAERLQLLAGLAGLAGTSATHEFDAAGR